MAAPLKSRTFGGTEGVTAKGPIHGPDPLKNDEDNLFAAINPNANFTTGEPGGLQENNLHASLLALIKSIYTINNIAGDANGNLTLQAGTGIQISAVGNTIQITATGDMAPAAHAITHTQGGTDPIIGTLDADITGNAATATNATNATNAANVTTNINGHAITDIVESDGVTVKEATHAGSADSAILAEAAKTDKRFLVSAFSTTETLAIGHNQYLARFGISLLPNYSFKLKNVNYLTQTYVVIEVDAAGVTKWYSTTISAEEAPNLTLITNTSGITQSYVIELKCWNSNMDAPVNLGAGRGGLFEFAKELI